MKYTYHTIYLTISDAIGFLKWLPTVEDTFKQTFINVSSILNYVTFTLDALQKMEHVSGTSLIPVAKFPIAMTIWMYNQDTCPSYLKNRIYNDGFHPKRHLDISKLHSTALCNDEHHVNGSIEFLSESNGLNDLHYDSIYDVYVYHPKYGPLWYSKDCDRWFDVYNTFYFGTESDVLPFELKYISTLSELEEKVKRWDLPIGTKVIFYLKKMYDKIAFISMVIK